MPRAKIDIDPVQVQKFAAAGARNVEIADYFGCDEGTIRKRFAAELRKGRASRKIMLRDEQNKLARAGNHTMLIWLGKNELGQTDKQEITGAGGGPLTVKVVYTDAKQQPKR